MEITGSVRCLFEQSGTFRDVFRSLGFRAFDYDVCNDFGQTDCEMDLFFEIDAAFVGVPSIFDGFSSSDLLLAFFPCTYFSSMSQALFSKEYGKKNGWSVDTFYDFVISRSEKRQEYLVRLMKLFKIVEQRGLRLILENPATTSYLLGQGNFVAPPTLIDWDRTLRGDYFKKPTAYWFVNCQPEGSRTFWKRGYIPKAIKEEDGFSRSLISKEYAKLFINDYILGKGTSFTQLSLFSDTENTETLE